MGGTTSLGIRYPFQSEVVTAQSWQDMADDVDALLTELQTLRGIAETPNSAGINSGDFTGSATTVNNVLGTFGLAWDTGGYWNAGTPDRLTVPAGVYWISLGSAFQTNATTTTQRRAAIFIDGTTERQSQKLDTMTTSGNGFGPTTGGLLALLNPSQYIQYRVQWTGTGGPVNYSSGSMQVYKVRDIADL